VKEKLGAGELDGSLGVDVRLVSGASESIVHVCESGAPTFPAGSIALTSNVWFASARLL
jgi:hypothetical protein